jgi:hypothetical protein
MTAELPSLLSLLGVWLTAGLLSGWLVGLYRSGRGG